MLDLEALLQNKAAESKQEWQELVSSWSSYSSEGRLGEPRFEALVQACDSPEEFKLLMKSFQSFWHRYPQENPAVIFFREVDDSAYDLKDWVEALVSFYRWLHQNQRGSDLKTMLGYMSCCIESVDSISQKPRLKAVLQDMLKTHGFGT